MISRIDIHAIGPHEDSTIDIPEPLGWTSIQGASEVGKTVLVDAVTFALWGIDHAGRPFDLAYLHSDAEEAAAAVTTAKGTRISRRLRRKGRKITRGISGAHMPTELAHREALGPLGDLGPHLLPLRIMAPRGWLPLARSAGGGRDLRDCLASLGEAVELRDVVADLMAQERQEYGPEDASNEAAANSQRKAARRKLAQVEGALEEATKASTIIHATQPEPEDPTPALAVLEAAQAWQSYRYASQEAAEHAAAVGRLERWRERRKAIGDVPDTGSAMVVLREDRRRAKAKASRRVKRSEAAALAVRDLDAKIAALGNDPDLPAHLIAAQRNAVEVKERARGDLAVFRSAEGKCPTCSQPWDRAEAIEAAEAAVLDANDAAIVAEAACDDWFTAAKERQAIQLESVEAELEDARAAYADARKAIEETQAEVSAIETRIADTEAPAREHAASLAGLGPKPRVPPEPETAPPSCAEPTPEQVEAARATVAAAERSKGAADHHQAAAEQTRARTAELSTQLEEARAEAARCDALLRCCRMAPTEAARRALAALGDISPVSMRWTERGGVDVLVDGRPWSHASQGRQIVADAALRAGMRRAAGLWWLPIVIDQVQSVAGQDLPAIDGPVWELRTCEGPLTVRDLG